MKLFSLHPEPLNEERGRMLKLWLAKPELETLQTVIAALARMKEQDAIDAAHRCADTSDTPERVSIVGLSVIQSERYYTALSVLEEIKSNPNSWQTLKL